MNEKVTLTRSGWKYLLSTAVLFVLIIPLYRSVMAGETESISEILSRLDKAAHLFTGATAKIRVVTHTAIINVDETQTGTVAVRRSSSAQLSFLINFTAPDA